MTRTGRPNGRWLATVLMAPVLASHGTAQEAEIPPDELEAIRDAIRKDLRDNEVGENFAALVSLGITPDVRVVDLDTDGGDGSLSTLKLPYAQGFRRNALGWTPFVESSIALVRSTQRSLLSTADGGASSVESRSRLYGGYVGGGFDVPIEGALKLRPSLGAGLAYIDNYGRYRGEDVEDVRSILQGLLTDYEVLAGSVVGSLGLEYVYTAEPSDLTVLAEYSHAVSTSLYATDAAQDFTAQTDTFVARLEIETPTGAAPLGFPLSIATSIGGLVFLGDGRDALGFSHLAEAGMALIVDVQALGSPVRAVRLGVDALGGKDVSGVGLSFGARF